MSEEKKKRVLTPAQIEGLKKGREKAKANALLRKEKMKRLDELEEKDELQEYESEPPVTVTEPVEIEVDPKPKKVRQKKVKIETVTNDDSVPLEVDDEPLLKPKVNKNKLEKLQELKRKKQELEDLRIEKELELENELIEREMNEIRNKKLPTKTIQKQEPEPEFKPYFRFY
jgi:hypothetical protein